MSIRKQYKLAYSLLRSTTWDIRTFKITTMGLGIDQTARINALLSYRDSQSIDDIGVSYRDLLAEIHKESQ